MEPKLSLYSQYLDVEDEAWRSRACGIVALKILFDYWGVGKDVSIDELIKRGLSSDGYIEGVGWKHASLAELGEEFGLSGKNFDWYADDPDVAFKKLEEHLKKYPVICSVYKDLKPGDSGHLVVVYEFDGTNVFYLDPEAKTRDDIKRSAPLDLFLEGWKRRIMVLNK